MGQLARLALTVGLLFIAGKTVIFVPLWLFIRKDCV